MRRLEIRAALLIIDVQRGFDDPSWGRRNNPAAEQKIAQLLSAWRKAGRPVFHIRHMSKDPHSLLRPGQAGNEIKECVKPRPGETLLHKTVNSAFIGTDLEARLRKGKIKTLVMTGITTNHCVSTTARMAANLGFKVYVVCDATATFDRKGHDGRLYAAEVMHAVGLAELHGEFASVVSTAVLLALA